MITQAEVLKYFEYKDGNLYWKTMPCKRNDLIGTKAGTDIGDNRSHITINKKHYKTHRLVYFMFHGFMPKEVDHIDGNSLNNRIENLRPATREENGYNKTLQKNNTTGYKNVYWHKQVKKWAVRICFDKKIKHIGLFKDLELAALVAEEARNKYHKEFSCHF